MTTLAHSLTLQQAWDYSGSSTRQYTWLFLSMLQSLMGIFASWANCMPASKLHIAMYSQDLHSGHKGTSPFIWNRHNHQARSSIIALLTAWDVEWENMFHPGSYYQSTQLLAPSPLVL
jgi:hypothetical protein